MGPIGLQQLHVPVGGGWEVRHSGVSVFRKQAEPFLTFKNQKLHGRVTLSELLQWKTDASFLPNVSQTHLATSATLLSSQVTTKSISNWSHTLETPALVVHHDDLHHLSTPSPPHSSRHTSCHHSKATATPYSHPGDRRATPGYMPFSQDGHTTLLQPHELVNTYSSFTLEGNLPRSALCPTREVKANLPLGFHLTVQFAAL